MVLLPMLLLPIAAHEGGVAVPGGVVSNAASGRRPLCAASLAQRRGSPSPAGSGRRARVKSKLVAPRAIFPGAGRAARELTARGGDKGGKVTRNQGARSKPMGGRRPPGCKWWDGNRG